MTGWRDEAACAEKDTSTFFALPVGTVARGRVRGDIADLYAAARLVCDRCPVADECLRFALDTGQHDGMWGGLDEWQRLELRRSERRRRVS